MPTLEALLENYATKRAGYRSLVERGEALIQGAETALGRRLSAGERSDLLLDNFEEIPGSKESHALVHSIAAREAALQSSSICIHSDVSTPEVQVMSGELTKQDAIEAANEHVDFKANENTVTKIDEDLWLVYNAGYMQVRGRIHHAIVSGDETLYFGEVSR